MHVQHREPRLMLFGEGNGAIQPTTRLTPKARQAQEILGMFHALDRGIGRRVSQAVPVHPIPSRAMWVSEPNATNGPLAPVITLS